jgi:LmbE family N-acetylglucosaminyl deacetylase
MSLDLNIEKVQRLLVVAAHPDDEVLGCGATLARASEAGVKIFVKFLGEGVSARFHAHEFSSTKFLQQSEARKNSAIKALKYLDISDYEFGERLCGQFDTYPLLSIVKDIEKTIREFNPDVLMTHSESEVNIDHRITYKSVEVATRPTSDYVPRQILSFEIPCSGNWNFGYPFNPNVYFDAKVFWERKLQAWSYYADEARPFPFPRSNEGLIALAQFRGMQAGLELAEAFRLQRLVIR